MKNTITTKQVLESILSILVCNDKIGFHDLEEIVSHISVDGEIPMKEGIDNLRKMWNTLTDLEDGEITDGLIDHLDLPTDYFDEE